MYINIQKPIVYTLAIEYSDYDEPQYQTEICSSDHYLVEEHGLIPGEFYGDPESIKHYLYHLLTIDTNLAIAAYHTLEHQIESTFEYEEEFDEEYVNGFEEWEKEFRKSVGLESLIG